ncbi:DUF1203 domain-containing protein [Brachybacterium sp.]|uniref:DUF1203 domain-containing protein n=1 Tax=Brachybacterium sp. TaxID=1891286 RepID=UPI002ED25421
MMHTGDRTDPAPAATPSPRPTPPRYLPRAIPPAALSELRDRDDAGNALRPFVVADPSAPLDAEGSPLRCCLRSARAGERIALVSYAPLRRWAAAHKVDPGAYDEVGPVFVHAEPCPGPELSGAMAEYPHARTGALRTLRRYDDRGQLLGGALLEIPADATAGFDSAIDEAFADPAVALVHIRALEHGCFQFAVERPAPEEVPHPRPSPSS